MPDTTAPDPNLPPPTGAGGEALPKPRRRRRRRWPIVILTLVVLILVLVALLPTIASTGPVRSIILGQVDKRLPGRVAVEDWSLGWTGGLRLTGVRLFDAAERQVGQVALVSTEASLLGILRGNYDVGRTVVDGLDVNYPEVLGVVDAQPATTQARADAGDNADRSGDVASDAGKDDDESPFTVPDIRGQLKVTSARMTITPAPGRPPVVVRSLDADVKIPDINGPIESSVMVVAASDGREGRLATAGTLDVFEKNQLATTSLTGRQTLTVAAFDVAALTPVLPRDSIDRLAGVADGELTIDVQGAGGRASGGIAVSDVEVAGPALKGDTYRTSKLVLTVPDTAVALAGAAPRITVGESGAGGQIEVRTDQGHVAIAGDLPVAALERVAAGQAPGDAGALAVTADVDIGKLAASLPQTFALRDGVTVTGGRLDSRTRVEVAPERATVTSETRLTDVAGTADGRPVRLEPVTLTGGATAVPADGGLAEAVRDVRLLLTSSFAQATVSGPTLADVTAKVTGQLDAAQRDLGQFVDFGGARLAGGVDIAATFAGDPTAGGIPPFATTVALSNVDVTLPPGPPATQPAADGRGEPPAPLPPLRVLGGQVAIDASFKPAGDGAILEVSKLAGQDLALERGGARYAFQPVNLRLSASVDRLDAPAVLTVDKLAGSAGVADVAVTEPVRVTNLDADVPTVLGAVRVDGQIEQLARLIEALGGEAPGAGLPYTGRYAIVQAVASTGGATFTPKGTVEVTDLRVFDAGREVFHEPSLVVENDLAIDTAGRNLAVNALTVDMQRSGALKLAVTGGIDDWQSARRFRDVTATVDYDLARLWALVKPLVSTGGDALADAEVAGRARRTFTITGSLPVGEFRQSVRSLGMTGGLAADRVSVAGLDVERIDVPVTLRDGKLTTLAPDGTAPPPAACNGGTIDLGQVVVDLTAAPGPTVTLPQQQRKLVDVALNDVLVENLNNALYVLNGSSSGASLLTVTAERVEGLPLGAGLTTAGSGAPPAVFVVSLRNVEVGGRLADLVGNFARGNWREQLRGDVPAARVTIADGRVAIDDFVLEGGLRGRDLFRMAGSLPLGDDGPLDLRLTLPPDLLKGIDRNVLKYLPEGITFPVGGTKQAPRFVQADRIIQEVVGPALQRALLEQLGGGGKDDRPTDAAPPAAGGPVATQPAAEPDPVRQLIDLFKDDDDDDRKRDRDSPRKRDADGERRKKRREPANPQ